MFLQFSFHITQQIQQTVLVLNTVLLIAALVTSEIIFAEQPRAKRKQLVYFYPLFLVLSSLLVYAAYKQQRGW